MSENSSLNGLNFPPKVWKIPKNDPPRCYINFSFKHPHWGSQLKAVKGDKQKYIPPTPSNPKEKKKNSSLADKKISWNISISKWYVTLHFFLSHTISLSWSTKKKERKKSLR